MLGAPADGILRGRNGVYAADYSTTQKECEGEVLPVNILFDPQALLQWQTVYFADHSQITARSTKWSKLMSEVFPRFQGYQIPVIMLRRQTPKEAVCQVFENVNTGGVSLTVFELLTASFAADNFSLRDHWKSAEATLKDPAKVHSHVLSGVSSTEFLQALTLLVTYDKKKTNQSVAVSCKRKDILRLTLPEYQAHCDRVLNGLIEAAQFLQEQHVFSARDLPYGSQLVPLAAIFAELGVMVRVATARAKIARWYWCGVFGELYGGAIETRFARDLPEVVAWVQGGPEPSTVQDAHFAADRLLTMRTRNSAAYKGISVLLMREGCKDFMSGVPIDLQNYYGSNVDIHHIFPRAYCEKKGIDRAVYDCIINKTPLSYYTNRSIGGHAPSVYLSNLESSKSLSPQLVDHIVSTHLVDPTALRSNDFKAFFEARKAALMGKISVAMS